jgi:hypothetical protein
MKHNATEIGNGRVVAALEPPLKNGEKLTGPVGDDSKIGHQLVNACRTGLGMKLTGP